MQRVRPLAPAIAQQLAAAMDHRPASSAELLLLPPFFLESLRARLASFLASFLARFRDFFSSFLTFFDGTGAAGSSASIVNATGRGGIIRGRFPSERRYLPPLSHPSGRGLRQVCR